MKGSIQWFLLTPALSRKVTKPFVTYVCQAQDSNHVTFNLQKQTSMILVCHGGSLMHQWPIVAVTFLKSARMFEHPKNAPDTSANHPWRTNAAWRIRAITLNVEKIWKIGTKKRGLFPLGLQTSLFNSFELRTFWKPHFNSRQLICLFFPHPKFTPAKRLRDGQMMIHQVNQGHDGQLRWSLTWILDISWGSERNFHEFSEI